MHISVHKAQRISFRRPVARTAARKSASSQALMLVRSIGGSSASTSASSGTVGSASPLATLIVEWTIDNPNSFAIFAVETMFSNRRSRSIELTAANWPG